MSAASLERRYRRLLWAYPRPWRRRHGAEIVTTLLELADDGQARPHRSEAWHLVRGGLATRLRVPRRPLALTAAVLAAVLLGLLGAAAGSLAGWATAPALPGAAAQDRLARTVAGVSPDGRYGEDSGAPWFGAAASLSADTSAAPRTPRQLAAALTGDGWRATVVTDLGDGGAATADPAGAPVPIASRVHRVSAARDGLLLQATTLTTAANQHLIVLVTAAEPAAVRPLIVAGLLLGGLAGWLAAAAAARARRRAVTVLGTAALATLVLPAVAVAGNGWRLLRAGPEFDFLPYVVHAALQPGPYFPPLPGWSVPALTIAGAVLGVAALVLAARPGPAAARPAAA